MYCGYITTIKEIHKHSNADRLACATIFGNNVIVDLTYEPGKRVVYFPVDGQLSEEFCKDNDLVRRKDENGKQVGGYLDPDKRNIRAIKLRGEKSEGLALPIESLSKYCNVDELKDGDQITILNGHEICCKYIPKRNHSGGGSGGNRTRSNKERDKQEWPLFEQHVETEQLAYNESAFKPGDTCYITLKVHGTSARTSNTIHVQQKKQTLVDKILHRPPKYELSYDVISGTRRTVLRDYEHGYYGNDAFRKGFHDFFAERLPKGLEVFYEVAGWVDENTPIMGRCKNKLIKDPEFVKQYGEETVFHYGCKPGESRCFVYRMTMTNQDGFTVEIPTEQCKLLCEKMGVEFVPIFEKFFFTTWDDLMQRVEKYYDGPDPIGKTHIREGVVVRIENREKFEAYKHKNFSFKCLSGIIADNTDADKVDEEILSEM